MADKVAADMSKMAADMTSAQEELLREREALNNLQVGSGRRGAAGARGLPERSLLMAFDAARRSATTLTPLFRTSATPPPY